MASDATVLGTPKHIVRNQVAKMALHLIGMMLCGQIRYSKNNYLSGQVVVTMVMYNLAIISR
jgi:hypothetical protein